MRVADAASYSPPERDSHMSMRDDPRLHPALLKEFERLGLLEQSFLAPQISSDPSLQEICSFVQQGERSIQGFLNSFNYDVAHSASLTEVVKSREVIKGDDGNDITLIKRCPSTRSEIPLPAVVYFHGGGMVILDAENAQHVTWTEEIARRGLVAITVDFRNALGADGLRPFPAGLDDCVAAVRWIHSHRKDLGICKIVLQGNSGGANLAMAVALRASKENWLEAIDGVHASSPYISGAYGRDTAWKSQHLPSLVQLDGYAISIALAALNQRLYDPQSEHCENPLAWPYWATEAELHGLPPHFIVTNELDPYRDEGNVYASRLARAGVRVISRSNLGITHEAELAFRRQLPDLFLANLGELIQFTHDL